MNNSEQELPSGTLFVVSTPIGNLQDITLRALHTLKGVDLIAAEDTRHSRGLLQHFGIDTPTTSYFDFNKEKKIPILVAQLETGARIALISDAGTPGISDPGFKLIRACIEKQITVIPIPGATALIPALVTSGLPTDRFAFEGFLPVKKGRKTRLERLQSETRTMIFYESPFRISRTLRDLHEYFGNRKVSIGREITKMFEETVRGDLVDFCGEDPGFKQKGEFVIVVTGNIKQKEG